MAFEFYTIINPAAPPPQEPPPTSFQQVQQVQVPLNRKERIEAAIGERVGVKALSPNELAAVMRDGVIVTAWVHYYRGTSKLTSDEMGMSGLDSKTQACIKAGKKILLPTEYLTILQACDTTGRNALYDSGLKMDRGYFVPTPRFKAFKSQFLEAKSKFLAGVEKICQDYDLICNKARETFRGLADKVWLARRVEWSEGVYPPGTFSNHSVPTTTFVNTYLEEIVAQIPKPDEIRAMADMDYKLDILHRPEAELASSHATSDADVQDELKTHLVNQRKNLIDDFLMSARQGLADAVQKMVTDVQETIAGKPKVHGKTVSKILAAIVNIQSLNVINDETIHKSLEDLRKFVEASAATGGKTSTESLSAQLQDVVKQVSEGLAEKSGRLSNLL